MKNENGLLFEIARLEESRRQIDARLAGARLKLVKHKQKDGKKLIILLGESVCAATAESAEFHQILKQTLGDVVKDAAARRFLQARGYIA